MKDIKKLYLAAKTLGKSDNIKEYTECVREYLESNPYQYMSNLEYIISSDIGLSTFKEFVERYGISIAAFNDTVKCLTENSKKTGCSEKMKSMYESCIDMMNEFHSNHQNCFAMFESYSDKLDATYVESYYKAFPVLKNAEVGKTNLGPIINRFGESCIPDMLIYASKFANPEVILESVKNNINHSDDDAGKYESAILEQWLCEAVDDVYENHKKGDCTETICLDRTFFPSYFKKLLKSVDDDIVSMIKQRVTLKSDLKLILDGIIRDHSGSGNIHKKNGKYEGKHISVCMVSPSVETKYKTLDKLLAGIAKDLNPKFEKENPGYTLRYDGDVKNMFYLDLDSDACKELWDGCNKPKIKESKRVVNLRDKTLESKVKDVKKKASSFYRESVLTGNDCPAGSGYTDEDISNIKNLIAFKESKLTCLTSPQKIMKLQNEIYDLYESFGSILEEDVADNILPMLPADNNPVTEPSLSKQYVGSNIDENTSNKKTGDIPAYLKRNHDMSYGEEDPVKKSEETPEPAEPTLDSLKRPSATDDLENKITPYNYDNDENKDPEEDHNDDEKDTGKDKHHSVNNYYYYSYNNSNNKNMNSFNRHNQDDHSTGKRIHSDDNTNMAHGESVLWNINDLLAQPLTEMSQLEPEDYAMYSEATSMLITEANDDEAKPGIIAKLKTMFKKLIDFLINTYERLFPKNMSSFNALSKKYKKSEKAIKACADNKFIIKVMEMNVPIIIGVANAFGAIVDYINNDTIPKGSLDQYQIKGSTRILIYYGSPESKGTEINPDMSKVGFYIASDAPKSNDNKLLGNNLSRITSKLDTDNLLRAFGIRLTDISGRDVNIGMIRKILSATKLKVYSSPSLWYNVEDRKKMLALIKAIADVTDSAYRTMNQAYRSATTILNDIEHDRYVPFGVKTESVTPWQLDVFGNHGYVNEAVGDADEQKPTSDNPIQDTMLDLDRKLASKQQAVKKRVQGVVNTSKTITKPFRRTAQWLTNMVANWKDSNENDIKERMADPHARSTLFNAVRSAIKYGSLMKAGLLLNPIILFLTISRKWSNSSKEFRLRNEMIGELKAELEIIDEKIRDAGAAGDNKAKYQLMRFKNELNKKLIRVGGTKGMAKMI